LKEKGRGGEKPFLSIKREEREKKGKTLASDAAAVSVCSVSLLNIIIIYG